MTGPVLVTVAAMIALSLTSVIAYRLVRAIWERRVIGRFDRLVLVSLLNERDSKLRYRLIVKHYQDTSERLKKAGFRDRGMQYYLRQLLGVLDRTSPTYFSNIRLDWSAPEWRSLSNKAGFVIEPDAIEGYREALMLVIRTDELQNPYSVLSPSLRAAFIVVFNGLPQQTGQKLKQPIDELIRTVHSLEQDYLNAAKQGHRQDVQFTIGLIVSIALGALGVVLTIQS